MKVGGKGVWPWFRLEKTRGEDIIEASKNCVTAMNTWNAESFTYPRQFWLGTPHGTMDDLRWCGGTLYEANADHRSVIGGVSESFPRSSASWPTEKKGKHLSTKCYFCSETAFEEAPSNGCRILCAIHPMFFDHSRNMFTVLLWELTYWWFIIIWIPCTLRNLTHQQTSAWIVWSQFRWLQNPPQEFNFRAKHQSNIKQQLNNRCITLPQYQLIIQLT